MRFSSEEEKKAYWKASRQRHYLKNFRNNPTYRLAYNEKIKAKYDPDKAKQNRARLTGEQKAKYNENEKNKLLSNPEYAERRREDRRIRQQEQAQNKRLQKNQWLEANKERILAERLTKELKRKNAYRERHKRANLSPEVAERIREQDRNRKYVRKKPDRIKPRIKSDAEKLKDKEYAARNRERILARQKQWRIDNKERLQEEARERRKTARYKEVNKQSHIKHSEHIRLCCKRRRLRARTAEGKYTAQDIASLFLKQSGKCAGCEADMVLSGKGKYHIDHYLPLVLGGTHWPSNIQLLCPHCNLSKSGYHPTVWEEVNQATLYSLSKGIK